MPTAKKEGVMGRPRKLQRPRQIGIYVEQELYDAIEEMAYKADRSVGAQIRVLLREIVLPEKTE